jgi:amino acid transporter
MAQPDSASSLSVLERELGVFGATMMGLGSIVGTGVFVSIGIAAGILWHLWRQRKCPHRRFE